VTDLLQDPRVAVRVREVGERAVVGVRGIGAGSPLARVAVEVADLAHLHSALCDLGACRLDVRDDEMRAAVRPRCRVGDPRADGDRAGGAGWRHLHDPESLHGGGVDVERESEPLRVEGLRAVDVGNGHEHQLELQVHDRSSPVSALETLVVGRHLAHRRR